MQFAFISFKLSAHIDFNVQHGSQFSNSMQLESGELWYAICYIYVGGHRSTTY